MKIYLAQLNPTVGALARYLGESGAPAAVHAEESRQKKLEDRMAKQRRALGRGRTGR